MGQTVCRSAPYSVSTIFSNPVVAAASYWWHKTLVRVEGQSTSTRPVWIALRRC